MEKQLFSFIFGVTAIVCIIVVAIMFGNVSPSAMGSPKWQALEDVSRIEFARHPNGLCVGVLHSNVNGGRVTAIMSAPDSACQKAEK